MSDKKIIINVGRQLGSGGHIIATMLAKTFDCEFYDKELLYLAAKESGFNEKFLEKTDEKRGLLKSLLGWHLPLATTGGFYGSHMSQENLFKIQSDAIRKAAESGSCVFVGRCADYVLRDFDNMVNVFITSDLDERIQRVSQRHDCDAETAHKIITEKESERSAYYNYYTGKRWGDSSSYDLCINSSILGVERTADYISQFIRLKLGI